jgi:hypothetical protein
MKPDFKQNAKWNRGDLLYGTSDSRGIYLKTNFPQQTFRKHFSYIDDYNNRFFCNTLADGFSDEDSMNEIINQLNNQSGKYKRLLSSHQKYSPQVTLKMNPFVVMQKEGVLAAAEKIAKECEKLDAKSAKAKKKKADIKKLMYKAYERKAIRRGCKYGIQMVAMELNSDIPDAHIHFLLDEMDMKDVIAKKAVDKSDLPVRKTYKYVYITTTELRSACRYWKQFKQDKIHFYLDGEEVGPPWLNAWTKKKDCLYSLSAKFRVLRDNDPSWWAPLTGVTVAPQKTSNVSSSKGKFKTNKFQNIFAKFEKGNVKNS